MIFPSLRAGLETAGGGGGEGSEGRRGWVHGVEEEGGWREEGREQRQKLKY